MTDDPDQHKTRPELLAELRALRAQLRAPAVSLVPAPRLVDHAAQQREEQLRLIFDAVPALLTYVDADGHYRLVNQQYADWFGRTRDDIRGRHVREVAGEVAFASARRHIETALDGHPACFEMPLERHDGSQRWVQATYVPHLGPDGRALGYVTLVTDITARKRIERELRSSREQLEVVLRGVDDGITLMDHTGTIVYANAALAMRLPDVDTLLAIPTPDLVARFVLMDSDGQRIPHERTPTQRALLGEPVHEQLLRFHFRGERDLDRWSVVSAIPMCDETGAVRFVVNIFRDVTERRDAERALQAQHQLNLTITDNATAALLLLDARQHCTFMNPAAVAMLGYTLADVQGRPLHDFIHPPHRDGRPYSIDDSPIDRALPQRRQQRGEDLFMRKDGALFPVAFTASPIVTDGHAVGTVIEVQDITEHQLVQDQLRLRARVLQSMTEGVCVTDEHATIIYTNPAEDAMFGYAAGELVGQHVSVQNGYSPEENLRVIETVMERLRDHGSYIGEFHNRKKDGTPFVTHARITPLELSGKRHYLCVQDDITQEKRDREALRFLADASIAMVASLDYDRALQDLTRLAVPRLGSWCSVYLHETDGPVELVAVTHIEPARADLVRELHRQNPVDQVSGPGLGQVLRTGKSLMLADIDDPFLQRTARGPAELAVLRQLAPRSWMMAPLTVQGRTFGAISLVATGTRRRYDAADLALLEELARRASVAVDNARLFAMAQKERARAEEANRAKDLFLSTLSHELRTPLTAILGWTHMLRTSNLSDDKRARGLETIDRNARAQVALIEDILDLSRIVTGKLRLDLQPVDLHAVVLAAVDTVRPAADARDIRLTLHLDPDPGPVVGDANRLQQALWNLLTNAVKFTPHGGRVDLGMRRDGAHLLLTVRDTGQGIGPAFLPHVFERFRQGDASTTRPHGGLGLGLAIVKHLIELHGGTVDAASPGDGQGATFTVRIPASPQPSAPASAPEQPALRGASTLGPLPDLHGLKILIVDDEDDARGWISTLLEHCHATVFTAASAAQALDLLHTHRPDIIVSDIGMPLEDGYTLIKNIRALAPADGGRTPAIALTAYARMEDRTRAIVAGFNMHVAKPIEPAELLIRVANLTGRLPAE